MTRGIAIAAMLAAAFAAAFAAAAADKSSEAIIRLLNSRAAGSPKDYAQAVEIVAADAERGRPLQQFILGVVVVLAEPAIHVLNKQVEDITNRAVSHRTMMVALAIGSGISLALSMLRIIFNFSILYYLIPGYLISLGLSLLVPKMYTGIAFDSGGVASGPLTSGFILPMAIGFCSAFAGQNEILNLGFGIVAMVAMTPLITIQVLGFRSILSSFIRYKRSMKRIVEADDEQIIYFE